MATTLDATEVAASAETDATRALPRAWVWWVGGFLAWTTLALLAATQTAMSFAYRGQPVRLGWILAWGLVDWYTCGLFIPPLLWLVRRMPLERQRWRGRLPVYVLATLGASLAKYAVTVPIQRAVFDADRRLGAVLAGNVISELMIFWAVVGVLHAVEFYLRYREREAVALQLRARLSEAQLGSLRAQLHPHFLFNTLNAATALLHRDAEAADAMLTRLADLLRLTLRADATHETQLREEMALVERYLDIMRVRFAEQLTVTCDVPEDLAGAMVPTFVLQPLIENALEHGVSRLGGPGRVEIGARRDGTALVLAVRDDGPGGVTPRAGFGIGLANTRRRLAELYGDRASLALRPVAGGGTEAELRLPLRTGG